MEQREKQKGTESVSYTHLAELKKAIFTIADGETYIQPSLIPALNSKMIQKNEDELKICLLYTSR